MKLTIIRLAALSEQDRIDLEKIWPGYNAGAFIADAAHRLYAARFNERLLGAVRVTVAGSEAELSALNVREVTRRRGVGQYLLEETLRDNPEIRRWWMANSGIDDVATVDAFMQACGFSVCGSGWEKQ